LIEEHGAHWLLQGELRTLCGWLDALPTTVLLSRPRLRLLNLSALMLDARWDCVEPLLRDMTALSMLDQQSEAAILQALGALMAGHLATAEATLAVARRLAHDDDGFIQTMLILLDGAIAWVGGAQERAQTVLATLTIPGLAGSGRQIALLAIAHQAHFDAVAGRLEPAILRYRQVCAQAKADRSEGTLALGMAALGLAQLHYERNELDAAVEAAGQAMAEAQRWGQQGLAASATLVQAQSLLAQGELSTATSLVHRLELAVRRVPLQQVDMICLALARAELALAQEETMIAASWLASLTAELYQLPPGQLRERVQRAQARVLLGRGDADAAAALLAPLLQAADERGRINSLVPLLALAAIAAEALGQQREALILLERAVGLGAGGPYVQSMLEGGPSLFGLLDKLQAVDAGVVRYIQLLRTTADARQRQRDRVLVGELESLSLRERAVLRLIASGATNREIALQLALAESTVKKYLASIYQKLGVVRRTQALAEARARDLL
jgi:LuxR family maltose regulon positive regulatory protein